MDAAAHSHHEHHDHHEHGHHEMPTSGRALDGVALSATLHCLTGCAIGEVTGMVIGTALGFSDWGTIALAVALAFLFGYSLTSLPLLRAGLALGAVIPIAFASDTISIAIMEVVDNAIMLVIPGAMEAGVDSVLFWGALSVALVIAGAFAFPANRWLIKRGKGHVAVHETGIHGGPPVKLVGAIAAVAAVFGTTVLIAEAVGGDGGGEHGGGHAGAADTEKEEKMSGGHANGGEEDVRGLGTVEGGLKLELARTELPRGQQDELRFRIVSEDGKPVRDYEVEHTKRMHLIVVRRDMSSFQHLHPELGDDGEWSTSLRLDDAGNYRVFADFKRQGENHTLAADLAVDGPVDWQSLPAASANADAGDGYQVRLDGGESKAGREAEVGFTVTRDGEEIHVDDYLGAKGHLVALREGDLAYLHVHPAEAGHGEHGAAEESGGGEAIKFATEFPSDGRYRLFLQFKHQGKVRTAAFTREVG
jgi:Domain of unknown function (DUF4396)